MGLQTTTTPNGGTALETVGENEIITEPSSPEITWWKPGGTMEKLYNKKHVQAVLMFALFWALFATDVFLLALADNSHDAPLHMSLFATLLIFSVEIFVCSFCQAAYKNSFFFWMDIIGTLSLVFDIPWIAEAFIDQQDSNSAMLRASRTTRLGARATRITKVLRLIKIVRVVRVFKLFKYLKTFGKPGEEEEKENSESLQSASKISGQLGEMTSKRVAALVMLLVIVQPFCMYDDGGDSSLAAFLHSFENRLDAVNMTNATHDDSGSLFRHDEIKDFFDFYEDRDIRPYRMQVISPVTGDIQSYQPTPIWYGITRRESTMLVLTAGWSNDKTAITIFINAADRIQSEAMLSFILIWVVIIVLVGFSQNISKRIDMQVIEPIERIFAALRDAVGDVLSAAQQSKDGKSGKSGSNTGKGEMDLLENAVGKLSKLGARVTAAAKGNDNHEVSAVMNDDNVDDATKSWLQSSYTSQRRHEKRKSESRSGASVGRWGTAVVSRRVSGAASSSPKTSSSTLISRLTSSAVVKIDNKPTVTNIGKEIVVEPATGKSAKVVPTDEDDSELKVQTEEVDPPILTKLLEFEEPNRPTPVIVQCKAPVTDAEYQLMAEKLKTLEFNALAYSNAEDLFPAVRNMLMTTHCTTDFGIEDDTLWSFIGALHDAYNERNSYHNFYHAVDVCQTLYHTLLMTGCERLLQPTDILAALVGALGHDVRHPGVNQQFLVMTKDDLAMTYNDSSVLENMHVSSLYKIILHGKSRKGGGCNIMANLTDNQWADVRKAIVHAVLATDMAHHFKMVGEVDTFSDVNEQSLRSENMEDRVGLFQSGNNSRFLLGVLMHMCDISNAAKSMTIAEPWADRVVQEFFAQGDKEKELGFPISPMFDRHNTNIPSMQCGFIEFVVAPLFGGVVKIFPELDEFLVNLSLNRRKWGHRWIRSMPRDSIQQCENRPKNRARLAALEKKFDFCPRVTEAAKKQALEDTMHVLLQLKAAAPPSADVLEKSVTSILRKDSAAKLSYLQQRNKAGALNREDGSTLKEWWLVGGAMRIRLLDENGGQLATTQKSSLKPKTTSSKQQDSQSESEGGNPTANNIGGVSFEETFTVIAGPDSTVTAELWVWPVIAEQSSGDSSPKGIPKMREFDVKPMDRKKKQSAFNLARASKRGSKNIKFMPAFGEDEEGNLDQFPGSGTTPPGGSPELEGAILVGSVVLHYSELLLMAPKIRGAISPPSETRSFELGRGANSMANRKETKISFDPSVKEDAKGVSNFSLGSLEMRVVSVADGLEVGQDGDQRKALDMNKRGSKGTGIMRKFSYSN